MTSTFPDPVATVNTLLSTYWDSSKTSNITPNFKEMRKLVVADQTYHLVIYRRPRSIKEVGRGANYDHTDLVTIDLRVESERGNVSTAETVFFQMINEIYRICGHQTYRVNPGNGYSYIRFAGDNDQSYRVNNFFRILIDYELERYGVCKDV